MSHFWSGNKWVIRPTNSWFDWLIGYGSCFWPSHLSNQNMYLCACEKIRWNPKNTFIPSNSFALGMVSEKEEEKNKKNRTASSVVNPNFNFRSTSRFMLKVKKKKENNFHSKITLNLIVQNMMRTFWSEFPSNSFVNCFFLKITLKVLNRSFFIKWESRIEARLIRRKKNQLTNNKPPSSSKLTNKTYSELQDKNNLKSVSARPDKKTLYHTLQRDSNKVGLAANDDEVKNKSNNNMEIRKNRKWDLYRFSWTIYYGGFERK